MNNSELTSQFGFCTPISIWPPSDRAELIISMTGLADIVVLVCRGINRIVGT